MKKKLQVFVSSTYTDLREERQAAVQAILNVGHIPAGMELFTAGDESQKETIKKWIDESDVYMLILGGRYGAIDPVSGKSYTHWEYDYAGEIGKPRFAVVISDKALDEKVKRDGKSVLEMINPQKYDEFKQDVLSKISKFFDDSRDIQLALIQKMSEFATREDLVGWISGKDAPDTAAIVMEYTRSIQELQSLQKENTSLREELATLRSSGIVGDFFGLTYHELRKAMISIKITYPEKYKEARRQEGDELQDEASLFRLFLNLSPIFATGIPIEQNGNLSVELEFIYYQLVPKLMQFGLIEKIKGADAKDKLQTTKQGFDFLRLYELDKIKKEKEKQAQAKLQAEADSQTESSKEQQKA